MRCVTRRSGTKPERASLQPNVRYWRMTAGCPELEAHRMPMAMRSQRSCSRPAKACAGFIVQFPDQDVENGDPYLRLFLNDGVLRPGQSAYAVFSFARPKDVARLNYTLELLSGQGQP